MNHDIKKKLVFLLIGIVIISTGIKLYGLYSYDLEPHDSKLYYYYGKEIASHYAIPKDSSFLHNLGFPLILAPVFKVLDYPYETSMIIQKHFTILLSSVTIPLVYLFARRFFEPKYAIIGAAIFAFDPRIIQNSTLGITEPLYILLFFASLIFCFRNNLYLAFFVAGCAATARFEGIILFPILLMFMNDIRKKRTVLLILLFAIPMIMVMSFYISSGANNVTYQIQREISVFDQITDDPYSEKYNQPLFLERIANSFVYLGWFTFPMFLFFIPLGIYLNRKNKKLILALVITAGTGLWAYLDAFDTRYFFHMYPFILLLILPAFRFLFGIEKVKPIERH